MIGNIMHWALGGIIGLFLLVLGWVVTKYLKPWLGTGFKLALARQIVVIADDVTDYFVQQYPENKVAEWFDKAVDKIREIIGPNKISKEVAKRAISGAVGRRYPKLLGKIE